MYYLLQVCGWYFGGRDIEGEDLVSKVFKGEVLPCGCPVAGEGGDFFGDKQTAIGGKALEDNFFE